MKYLDLLPIIPTTLNSLAECVTPYRRKVVFSSHAWILVTAASSLLDPSHNFNLQIPHIPCEPHDLARPKTSCQKCLS